MSAFGPIALNGFREARRNRVTVVVGVFAALMVVASALVADTSVATVDRVMIDVGLGGIAFLLAMLAIFLSSGLLSREIERRTIYLMVTKPVSRSTFLLARAAGNMLTLLALHLAMTPLFFAMLWLFNTPVEGVQLVALGLLGVELLVLTSFGLLMSSFAGQFVSAMTTVGIYFAGHLSADLYRLATRVESDALRGILRGAYYLLPNLSRLNLRPQAAYSLTPEAGEVLASATYGLFYAGVLLALACAIFSRRDFK